MAQRDPDLSPDLSRDPSSKTASWFHDEATLLEELKLARPALPEPVLSGYSDLVELHRGGQGVVYAAVQTSTRRRVAVKILLAGAFASEAAKQRFRREIDLAASLRHPNIVRVYDSGLAAGDNPYLVMEFVEGVPVDEHGRGLDLRGRVELLATVGAAVQFAHQKGVIHRDLKPSNIRVDSDGVPRVLDFGLAKLHTGSSAAAGLTESGHFMGSLPWASPEQVSGDPQAVDVRSDVYALGVMLYQLLAGRPPYDVGRGLRTAVEAIMNTNPPPLRGVVPGLSADLEVIAATALAKRPESRYQSAGELERDLRSYLAGEPIMARRETAWRTLRRRARRYQAATVAAAIVLVVVGVSLVVTAKSLREASRARDMAERRADQRQAVNEFLLRTLSGADPAHKGRDAKIVDMLDASAGTVDPAFHDDPATAATVHGTIGMTYRALALYDEADKHVSAQLDLARKIDGPDGPETLAGELNMALMMRTRGKGEEAAALAKHVDETRARTLGEAQADTIEAANVHGLLLADLGRFDEGEKILRGALDRSRALWGEEDGHTLEILNNLASTLRQAGKPDQAAPFLEKVAAVAPKVLGSEHPDAMIMQNNWANYLMNAGRPQEAEPVLREVVEKQRRVLGPDHTATVGTLCNLATSLQRQNKMADAEALFRECIELSTKAVGAAAVRTLIYRNNLATLLRDTGRAEEARRIMEGVAADAAATLGPTHHLTATFEDNLAGAMIAMKDFEPAEAVLLRAHGNLAGSLGEAHNKTRELAGSLADLYHAWGKADQEAQWRKRAEGS